MAGAQELELLSKRKRAIGEIKCGNIEQHWEGNSMNTESACLFSLTLVDFTPKGVGEEKRSH